MLQPRNPLQVFDESHQTFESLLHVTESMLQELAYAASIIASRSKQITTFRDWQIQEDNSRNESLFLELVDSYELPFDRLHVNRAMRRFYGDGNSSNSDKCFCEVRIVTCDGFNISFWRRDLLEVLFAVSNPVGTLAWIYAYSQLFKCSQDTICRQVIHAYSHKHLTGHVRHREVVRNLSDVTQSVFLSITLIQPVTASGEPIRGITLREQKWTIVRAGALDIGALATSATLIVQTYQKITMESVEPASKEFWTRSMLLESMVPMWDVSLGVNRRRLETYLVEQGMSASRRLQATELQ